MSEDVSEAEISAAPEPEPPPSVELPLTGATDSDLNELLNQLASQIKVLRRANKRLAGYNSRLIVALEENNLVQVELPPASPTLVISPVASARELGHELIRRLDLLEEERAQLKSLNDELAEMVKVNRLKTWKLKETRSGTSRLLPGPRAFIRRRRTTNS
ncbi:MAG: hypothetical protein ACREP9_23290 [Candidatus Dormibacteraceae bacterium]